jgi:transcriptional antiterminator RfaH
MKQWYVVHTQANKEHTAASHLERQGFEVYLPRYQKTLNHARSVRLVARPLFQRYLFVRVNTEMQRWRSINGTIGVSYLITNGEKPVPIPRGIVEAIQGREDNHGLVMMLPPVYAVGQRLEVLEGPMATSNAFFQKFSDNNNRVLVLLEMLGRKVRTSMPVTAVALA